MKRFIKLSLVYVSTILIFGWSCTTKETKPIGINLEYMDLSVDPAQDFFRFVNGKWLDSTEIPANEGRWGSFNELRKKNNKIVLTVLKKAASNDKYAKGTDQRKVAEFYDVGMDSLLAEARGIEPIKPWYTKIDAITSLNELQSVLEEMHIIGFNAFYGGAVEGDLKDSDINALYLAAGGLGLPNRDYYTKEDGKSRELREKYVKHIARMLRLSSDKEVSFDAIAKSIFDIEYKLALASLTPVEKRDIPRLYNPMTIAQLDESVPSINWGSYFQNLGIDSLEYTIVTEPKFMVEFNNVINNTPIEDIKWYLKWQTINLAAPYLNHEIVAANFDFYGKEIAGVEEMKPRWERVLREVNGALGEALGKLYVDEVFPPEAKETAKEMCNDILTAFGHRIDALDWMSDTTKEKAHEKLAKFTIKIGYPDKWKDYSDLKVKTEGDSYSYFSNVLNSAIFNHYDDVKKVGKPVDKSEWEMYPQTVNAYYNPINNEIVFPAAILQPPFYDYRADAAINYGGIGAVIGHEVSHGFDDQGSRFDANGNMENWWTGGDKSRFDERSKKLVAQFNSYEPLDSLHVQGDFTLGENIGDLGGVNVAYDALQLYFERHDKPGEIDGFTQEQRFFISWATIWRIKYRDEFLRTQVMSDPHSPGMYRAVGPLVNLETFYAAFDVKEGDAMWKPEEERVKIW